MLLGLCRTFFIPFILSPLLPSSHPSLPFECHLLLLDRGLTQMVRYRIAPDRLSKNADCHYMICGVQGDFTKALVSDPPKFLWTREIKVCFLECFRSKMILILVVTSLAPSLPAYPTPQNSTVAASASPPAQASAPPYQPACKTTGGSSSGSGPTRSPPSGRRSII